MEIAPPMILCYIMMSSAKSFVFIVLSERTLVEDDTNCVFKKHSAAGCCCTALLQKLS